MLAILESLTKMINVYFLFPHGGLVDRGLCCSHSLYHGAGLDKHLRVGRVTLGFLGMEGINGVLVTKEIFYSFQ